MASRLGQVAVTSRQQISNGVRCTKQQPFDLPRRYIHLTDVILRRLADGMSQIALADVKRQFAVQTLPQVGHIERYQFCTKSRPHAQIGDSSFLHVAARHDQRRPPPGFLQGEHPARQTVNPAGPIRRPVVAAVVRRQPINPDSLSQQA